MNGEYSNDHRPELMSVEKRLEKAHYHLSGDEFEEAGAEFTYAAELIERLPENYVHIMDAYKMAGISFGYAGMYSTAERRILDAIKFSSNPAEKMSLQDLQIDIYKYTHPDGR